jgi:4-azaleucine resistance transporter AzlC
VSRVEGTARGAFVAGVRTVSPVMLGVVPFGLVAGAAAVQVGLPVSGAVALSVVVFAGASQLAALELLGQAAPAVVVVLTALVINARMVMYSASIAPHLEDEPLGWRALSAYLLTDQAYALSVTRFAEDDVPRRWFYLGTAVPLWVVWQVCTVAGALAGASIPDGIPLSFAVPLTFLALLVPAVEDRSTAAAAVVGGTVATLGAGLPYNLGLLAGALIGIVVGVLAE